MAKFTREEVDAIYSKIVGADLKGIDLNNNDPTEANLYVVDLSKANLSKADLSRVDVCGTKMRGAEIIEQGNHAQLMATGGHYAELYDTYFRHKSLQ